MNEGHDLVAQIDPLVHGSGYDNNEIDTSIFETSPKINNSEDEKIPARKVDEDYTVTNVYHLGERFREPDENSKYGYLGERFLIGKDSKINGGCYYSVPRSEIIVIDDVKYPDLLNEVYNDILQIIQQKTERGSNYKTGLLTDIYDVIKWRIPYMKNYTKEIEANFANKKVALNVFINAGGVCRHQALLGAYILERLSNDGLVGGKVSIDRNAMEYKVNNKIESGGHAWIRYLNANGVTYIIDTAQDYVGKLEDAGEEQWEYRRISETPNEFIPRHNFESE